MGEKVRFDWVDVAKAFSILLVVLAHTRIEYAFINVSSPWADAIVELTGSMRMPLFFAASGVFAVKWFTRSWGELFSGKIALLAWVFLIWQAVVLGYKLLEMAVLPNQPDNSLLTQLGKVIVSPLRPNGELWFLWALCVFFVLAKLIWASPIWIKVGVPVVVSIAWFAGRDMVPESILRTAGAGIEGIPAYFVFFIGAATFAPAILKHFSSIGHVASALWFAAWIIPAATIYTFNVDIAGFRTVLSALAVAGGFGLARLLCFIRPLRTLGKHTLPIYVGHTAFVVAIVCSVYLMGAQGLAQQLSGLMVALTWIAAIGLSAGLYVSLSRSPWGKYLYKEPPGLLARRKVKAKVDR